MDSPISHFLVAIVNEIVFLISSLYNLLIVHKIANGFCVLTSCNSTELILTIFAGILRVFLYMLNHLQMEVISIFFSNLEALS